MGMFDTFNGWSTCVHCGGLNQVEIQFKWLDSCMMCYTIGDYVSGNEPFSLFSEDESTCRQCKKTYTTHVLGKMGYVFGFSNEMELQQIKEVLPLDKPVDYVQFAVSKEWLNQDIESVFKQLRTAYEANPAGKQFLLTGESGNSEPIEKHVCRVPSFVLDPHNRPAIGDTVYVDNRSSRYQRWNLQNKPACVTARIFREPTQDYTYTVSFQDGSMLNDLHESKLVDEAKRKEIMALIQQAEKEILTFYDMQRRPRDSKEEKIFRLKKMQLSRRYEALIEDLIATKMLPENFSLEA